MVDIIHGGKLDEAVANFGGDRSKWLDLSTGINPNPYPIGEIPAHCWTDLPDDQLTREAVSAVLHNAGADEQARVCLAPGAQMIIQTLPFLFKPQSVAVVGFTYQEHGMCWRRAGHEVYVTDGLESAESTARIVIVVNPNNPDGRIFDREDLIGLARRLAAKGGLLVVDESFGDVAPNANMADETGRDGLLVMRSLGKFFGLAGLRFGAALGAKPLVVRLQERLGPWAVSGPALWLAAKAMRDDKWQGKTRKKLAGNREDLEGLLQERGFEIVGGCDLFVLADHGRSEDLYNHLAEKKILVRQFPGKSGWLRFGLPGSKPALRRLDKAINGFYEAD